MPEMNTIYDNSNNIVGIFRFGVAWSKEPRVRLGEYDDDFIYDNNTEIVAKIAGDKVLNTIGDTIGYFTEKELFITDEKVGSYIGNQSAGAAAIVLLFSKCSAQQHS